MINKTTKTNQVHYKLALLLSLAFLLTLVSPPEQGYAQQLWPPFRFNLTPSYENGKIIYRVNLRSKVDWQTSSLAVKIPLPAGTRFVEANALPGITAEFDGQEVTFFTTYLNQDIEDSLFVVEVTEPTQTIFTTQAWITWQGQLSGDYLAEPVSIDITRQPLNWNMPDLPRLQLELAATVSGDTITYRLYPKRTDTRRRMWDVNIILPLPLGTTFLMVEAPPAFTSSFDGQKVSFFALELERQDEVPPLILKVSTLGLTTPVVTTHAWATWKNTGPRVGTSIPAQEELTSSEAVLQLSTEQQVVLDRVGDVPFANYDLTSIGLQENETTLTMIFHTLGEVGPVGQPVRYMLYLDSDCNNATGHPEKDYGGAEHRVRYDHENGHATLTSWEVSQEDWSQSQVSELFSAIEGNTVTISVPRYLIAADQKFCWVGRAWNRTDLFYPDPPSDWLSDEESLLPLTQYEFNIPPVLLPSTPPPISPSPTPSSPTPSPTPSSTTPVSPTPPLVSSQSPISISGRLAVPLLNEQGFYDVYIFALPAGHKLVQIPNAHQPHFHFDGQRLLVTRIMKYGDSTEGIAEYNFTDGTEKQIYHTAQAAHPFYISQGGGLVFDKLVPQAGADEAPSWYIMAQCGLLPASPAEGAPCQELVRALTPSGQSGRIRGNYPLWTNNNMIVYQGCDSPANPATCGIYRIDSWVDKASEEGAIPLLLTQDVSAIPADTKGDLITFTTYRDGNWEAYVMNLVGSNVRNVSNSLDSNDGLPTISPDGNWIAFVSDRNGRWAIWVVPVTGGSAQRLFELPALISGSNDDRAWTNERISWGSLTAWDFRFWIE